MWGLGCCPRSACFCLAAWGGQLSLMTAVTCAEQCTTHNLGTGGRRYAGVRQHKHWWQPQTRIDQEFPILERAPDPLAPYLGLEEYPPAHPPHRPLSLASQPASFCPSRAATRTPGPSALSTWVHQSPTSRHPLTAPSWRRRAGTAYCGCWTLRRAPLSAAFRATLGRRCAAASAQTGALLLRGRRTTWSPCMTCRLVW